MDEEKTTKKDNEETLKKITDNNTDSSQQKEHDPDALKNKEQDPIKENFIVSLRKKEAALSLNELVKVFFYVIAVPCLLLTVWFVLFIIKEFGNIMLSEAVVHLLAGSASALVGLIFLKIAGKIQKDTNDIYTGVVFFGALIFCAIIGLIADLIIRL